MSRLLASDPNNKSLIGLDLDLNPYFATGDTATKRRWAAPLVYKSLDSFSPTTCGRGQTVKLNWSPVYDRPRRLDALGLSFNVINAHASSNGSVQNWYAFLDRIKVLVNQKEILDYNSDQIMLEAQRNIKRHASSPDELFEYLALGRTELSALATLTGTTLTANTTTAVSFSLLPVLPWLENWHIDNQQQGRVQTLTLEITFKSPTGSATTEGVWIKNASADASIYGQLTFDSINLESWTTEVLDARVMRPIKSIIPVCKHTVRSWSADFSGSATKTVKLSDFQGTKGIRSILFWVANNSAIAAYNDADALKYKPSFNHLEFTVKRVSSSQTLDLTSATDTRKYALMTYKMREGFPMPEEFVRLITSASEYFNIITAQYDFVNIDIEKGHQVIGGVDSTNQTLNDYEFVVGAVSALGSAVTLNAAIEYWEGYQIASNGRVEEIPL